MNFINEDAVDRGGVMKEFFTLIMNEFVLNSGLLAVCGKHLWFTKTSTMDLLLDAMNRLKKAKKLPEKLLSIMSTPRENDPYDVSELFPEYLLGVFVGLALYNGVLVDVRLPSTVYKVGFMSGEVRSLRSAVSFVVMRVLAAYLAGPDQHRRDRCSLLPTTARLHRFRKH